MTVMENVESKMGSSDLNNPVKSENNTQLTNSEDHQISKGDSQFEISNSKIVNVNGNNEMNGVQESDGVGVNCESNFGKEIESNGNKDFKREMMELEDLLSKLNPMAEEFVPVSPAANGFSNFGVPVFAYPNGVVMSPNSGAVNGHLDRQNGYSQGKRRINDRTSNAQRDDVIRRTVYVSDIDSQITEEQLAGLFLNCGQVVDCRICGDPNSVLRFAFLEFTDEVSARAALTLSGTMLGFYPVKVMPSKTAIAPVNPTFLPRSEEEREMCIRTIYCTNVDKKVTQNDVKFFFETCCGEVSRIRLLGDYNHNTRIAFVEFVTAESAIAALNCSGVVLGTLAIRVSPSKTPVKPRSPRP